MDHLTTMITTPSPVIDRASRFVTMSTILVLAAEHFDLTPAQLLAKNRAEPLATQRRIAMYLCRRLTKASYPEIAEVFKKKHHTTVIWACESIAKQAGEKAVFDRDLRSLRAKISKALQTPST